MAGLPTTEQRKDDKDQRKPEKRVEDSAVAHSQNSTTPDIFPGPSSDGVSSPENPIIKCGECSEFLREYLKPDSEKCVSCTRFDKVCKWLTYMKSRRSRNHENKGCEICEMRLDHGKGLDNFSKIKGEKGKSGRIWSCPCCGSKLDYFDDLFGRAKENSREDSGSEQKKKVYRCYICSLEFPTEQDLVDHVFTVHVVNFGLDGEDKAGE